MKARLIMSGEKTLMPYLLDRKIYCVDYAIISHFDTDHVGGLLYIMENMKVKNVIISKQPESSTNLDKFIEILNEKNINPIYVKKGDNLKIEKNLYFNILWPDTSSFLTENTLNNNAIVCKLCYKNFSMLFTGDIEKEAENILVQEYKTTKELKSTILKVPHHGSKTSSTIEFLKQVSPKASIIGVGKNNLYGHPNADVLTRLKDLESKIYRTDEDGEIKVIVNSKGELKIKKATKNSCKN